MAIELTLDAEIKRAEGSYRSPGIPIKEQQNLIDEDLPS